MTLINIAFLNVWRDKWTYLAYFLSSVCAVFLFFSFAVAMFHPGLDSIAQGSTLSLAMGAGNILIYLFSFLFISYSVRAFMKNKEKNTGILMIVGASNKQLRRMLFMENMTVGIGAIVGGILLGLLFEPLSLMITQKVVGIEGFRFYLPIMAIACTIIAFMVLFVVIAFVMPRLVTKQEVGKLIKSDKRGETELKFISWETVLGSIGILVLLVVAITYSNVAAVRTFTTTSLGNLVIFLCGIGALYVIFVVGEKGGLSLFSKSKSYYKKTNMLLCSYLGAKLRSNVRMIFILTLLLTGTFVAIVALYSQQQNVEEKTKSYYPFAYTYITQQGEGKKQADFIEGQLKDKSGYQSVEMELMQLENRIGIMSETNYNQIINVLGGEEIDLRGEEVYLVSGRRNPKNLEIIHESVKELFAETGQVPKLVGANPCNITPEGYFNQLCIVTDDLYKGMNKSKGEMLVGYNYSVDNWEQYESIDQAIQNMMRNKWQIQQGYFSGIDLYYVEQTSKNLMLYVGSVISIMFVFAAFSMLYFNLVTEKAKEVELLKGIRKIGMTKREITSMLYKRIGLVMFIPFITASIFMFVGIGILSNIQQESYIGMAMMLWSIFLILQVIGYFFVVVTYKDNLLKALK